MKKITGVLENTIKALGYKNKIKEEMVHYYWKDVVGPGIAPHTESSYLKDGILFVKVSNSMWSQHLSFLKKSFINKLNHKLGSYIIKDIYFQVGLLFENLERSSIDNTVMDNVQLTEEQLIKIEETASEVEDEEIRDILINILKEDTILYEYKKRKGWLECHQCSALFKPRRKELKCPICLPNIN